MPLQSYQLTAEILEDDSRYAVVTLDDESTFGQIVAPGELEDIDRQIESAVERYETERVRAVLPNIQPVTRTAIEIEAAKQAKTA